MRMTKLKITVLVYLTSCLDWDTGKNLSNQQWEKKKSNRNEILKNCDWKFSTVLMLSVVFFYWSDVRFKCPAQAPAYGRYLSGPG